MNIEIEYCNDGSDGEHMRCNCCDRVIVACEDYYIDRDTCNIACLECNQKYGEGAFK